jgi:hypothetical protein
MNHNFEQNLILVKATEDALEKARGILGEFFPNFAVVVQYEDGSVWHESNNALVGKALLAEALELIQEEKEFEGRELEDCEIDWGDDDDDECV